MVKPDENQEKKIETTETESVEELKKALAEEKEKAEANLAGWQRAQADFVNYKRFAEQEKAEMCQMANAGLLSSILPVLDDFDRALASIPEESGNEGWLEGLSLINRKLKDTLKKQGVSQIQALGMDFDPYKMDAISCCAGEKDVVIQEVEKGYTLNDKVIRPAKVIVGTGKEDKEEE